MAFTMIHRAGWGAKPPESRTPWDVSKLEGICQHWFGTPRAAAHAGCDDLLRAVQRSHQAGEFSDIAYNIGVCPHGTIFELRGWHIQTGANGNADLNRRFLAVVYMAGVGDPLTPKGRDALIDVYAEAFRKGVGVKAVGHGAVAPSGTQCPGPQLRNFLASGVWRPKPPATKVRWFMTDAEGKPIGTGMAAFEPGTQAHESALLKKWVVKKTNGMVREGRADGDVAFKRRKA